MAHVSASLTLANLLVVLGMRHGVAAARQRRRQRAGRPPRQQQD